MKIDFLKLDERMKELAKAERKILSQVLLHIQECERYRLHLEFGYPNLFSYLTKDVGYSEGAAQRRIDAARLMSELPQVQEKLETGKLKLNQLSQIQKAARIKMKETSDENVPSETKAALKDMKMEAIEKLEMKSQKQTEVLIANLFDLPIQSQTKTHHQKDESVRIEFTLTKAQAEKLQKVKEALSHIVPDGNLVEVLDYMMTQTLTQKRAAAVAVKGVKRKSKISKVQIPEAQSGFESLHNQKAQSGLKSLHNQEEQNDFETDRKQEVITSEEVWKTKSVTPKMRKAVLERDQCCQKISKMTGKKCGGTWQLQVDHIQSLWAGGENTLENLQALCGQHNRQKYKDEARIRRS